MPELCSICLHRGPPPHTLVPDRFDLDPPYWYENMCLVCLDGFLDWMPVTPQMLSERELRGRLPRRVRFERKPSPEILNEKPFHKKKIEHETSARARADDARGSIHARTPRF